MDQKLMWHEIGPEFADKKSVMNEPYFSSGLGFYVAKTPSGWLVKSDSKDKGGLFHVDDAHHSWFPEITLIEHNAKNN